MIQLTTIIKGRENTKDLEQQIKNVITKETFVVRNEKGQKMLCVLYWGRDLIIKE